MSFSNIADGNNVSKTLGDKESVIDVGSVLLLPYISTDPGFDIDSKWNTVVVLYSHISGQKKSIVHKFKDGQWAGILKVGAYMNSGIWEKRMIAIFDKANDVVIIDRSHIVAAEEDLNII